MKHKITLLLLLYWAISLNNLTIVPPVYEDEPWQASTGWKLATEGVFGSDMFAGFYGMERRYYGYMPVHPLLLAMTFRIAGLGLFQDRFEPVAMGMLTLALTYALGRRLFDPAPGLLAVALLISARLTGLTRYQLTGIPLLDMARIARYDMVVPVFGLTSLHVYLTASRQCDVHRYALAGLLAGLAGLSHLYGAFWIVTLGILALWDGTGWQGLTAMAVGFAGPWLLYLGYVLSDLPNWAGQMQEYAPRFDLLNPRWYWTNLVRERHRYGAGLGPLGWHYLLRPGFWAALVALPASLIALARQAIRCQDPRARTIVVPALVFPMLFGLLISLKLVSYTVTMLPLAALAVAWGGVMLWRQAGLARSGNWVRPALAALLLVVTAEGTTRIVTLHTAAVTTTPYTDFIDRVRAHIPPGARVLGLHTYWLGLDDLDYRTWNVPLLQADPRYWSPPLAVDEALDNIAPDVILIDSRLRAYLEGAPATDPKPLAVRKWIESRGYEMTATVEDLTYGLMEIYQVEGSDDVH